MKKTEQEAIEAACNALDKAFDIDTFTYDRGNVMLAHGILKAIELSPSKPTAKTKAKAQPKHTAKVEKTENEKTAKAQTPEPA